MKSIINEFIECDVITEDHATSLLATLNSNEFPDEYTYQVAYVTYHMLMNGLYIKRESGKIRQVLVELFKQNPTEYNMLIEGNPKMNGFFIGRSMKELGKQYNPKDVQTRITEMIVEENMAWNFYE